MTEPHPIDRLFAIIQSRAGTDPSASYTAKLLAEGREKIARKLGEEAIEAVIELVQGNRPELVKESADLLYHLLVLWADGKVEPAEVWRALEARQGRSGIDEKKSRKP